MGLVLLGMGITLFVVGIIVLVCWVRHHQQVIDGMEEKLENVEDSLESAHKYSDQRIDNMLSLLMDENYKIHRRLEENSKEIHDRIDGEIKILERGIVEEVKKVKTVTDVKEEEFRRELNNVFTEINTMSK
jgi:K+ transporter